ITTVITKERATTIQYPLHAMPLTRTSQLPLSIFLLFLHPLQRSAMSKNNSCEKRCLGKHLHLFPRSRCLHLLLPLCHNRRVIQLAVARKSKKSKTSTVALRRLKQGDSVRR